MEQQPVALLDRRGLEAETRYWRGTTFVVGGSPQGMAFQLPDVRPMHPAQHGHDLPEGVHGVHVMAYRQAGGAQLAAGTAIAC